MLKKFILTGLPVLLLIAVLGFVAWSSTALPATPEALAALQSTPQVTVSVTEQGTVFQPAGSPPKTGLIFYPGGRVDYRAYAPLLSSIASQGYLVVLVPMPLNLAVFGTDRAQDVIPAFPQIQRWAVGGHSVGGSMAAQFVMTHPNQAAGLVLWAAYPGSSMADAPVQVISISGSQDGLATPQNIQENRALLPAKTRYVVIQGGNHSQFGSYGPQPGDNPAAISASAQWDQTVKATVELLQKISQ